MRNTRSVKSPKLKKLRRFGGRILIRNNACMNGDRGLKRQSCFKFQAGNMKTRNLFMTTYAHAFYSWMFQSAKRLAAAAVLVFILHPSVIQCRAAILSWSGAGGANANWNNSANWGFFGT